MQFKVGQKVRVKSRLWYERLLEKQGLSNSEDVIQNGSVSSEVIAFGFNQKMARKCGTLLEIRSVENAHRKDCQWLIHTVGNDWSWNEHMFEPLATIFDVE